MRCLKTGLLFCLLLHAILSLGQEHPGLMITGPHLEALRKGTVQYPLMKKAFAAVKQRADAALATAVNVPVPKDGGGGVTHEQHKKNYNSILSCGIAYQITQDKKYALYVKELLLEYARQYRSWPLHPARKPGQEPGRIFWQSLNDFVWQVNVIQGYDMVYEALPEQDREKIETGLFLPILKFFTVDCGKTFDKIHNHGTWALAAVGLTGYVLNKPEYVKKALNGSRGDRRSGYWAQLDQLFSPDGYYAEGPYYQRYALFPFVMLAKAIHNYQPELRVFEYRGNILSKAIATALQTTYTSGLFFPVNDAIKDKSFESSEIVYAVNIAYADMTPDPSLLDVAQRQNDITVSDAGLKVSAAIAAGKAVPFRYASLWLRDGQDGKKGGLGILRSGSNNDQQCLVLKATSQGMGHGHFDRLNLLYYDKGNEVFYDYGAARYLNIETKGGGGYLPENESWAKQTVAHNTLVIDQHSDFNGDAKQAEMHHPELFYFQNDSSGIQVMSADEPHAYPGVQLNRTLALVPVPGTERPLVADVFKATSAGQHRFDLPFWYQGDMVNTSFPVHANTTALHPLGTASGYQHIWLNAATAIASQSGFVSLLNDYRFYTTHFVTGNALEVKLVSTGANDPSMNIRPGRGFLLSQQGSGTIYFVSITESHGSVDPVNETVSGAGGHLSGLRMDKGTNGVRIFFSVDRKDYELRLDYTDKNNFIRLKQL
ncbi:heparinase II/III domain-containing protein [Niabella beijingensis]|uniref:heparinase II/III domain-containing protein n=1 Tax=Niabella beijingensis TaxID=2872700 RepID=UPI001CBB34D9|nr:heparinase II/III family protein [Niabella beijingensis]MBZ4188733.1 heparinase II/III family protein [Niabella beijingensis]